MYAIDASEEQVEQCESLPNLHFQVACAEQTKQADSSIDLVTVATALHWYEQSPSGLQKSECPSNEHGLLLIYGLLSVGCSSGSLLLTGCR